MPQVQCLDGTLPGNHSEEKAAGLRPMHNPGRKGGDCLCLDLGTQTGWARTVGADTFSGSASFHNGRYEGGGMRFLKFRNFLEILHRQSPVSVVYFEEVRNHKGVDASHIYGGFMAHLAAWCEEMGVPYAGIPVGTIKKHACGYGNAGKPEMIAAAKRRGYAPVDDNEADALCLLAYVLEERSVA